MKIWFPTVRAKTGADVFVERLANGLQKNGIETEITWYPHYLELIPHMLKFLKTPDKYDIAHTNCFYGFPFKNKDKKLVVTELHCVHDEKYAPYKNFFQKIYHNLLIHNYEKASFQSADAVTAISNYTKEQVKKSFPYVNSNLIYCGIDTDFFNCKYKSTGSVKFNLLYIGSHSKRKGFDLLLPIMNGLGDRFRLNYTGSYNSELHINLDSHNLGFVDNLGLLMAYQDCDALLFPTRYEGFGYTVCEAMSCSRPVITSNCSSLPELVIPGETGFLCEVDDVDGFCEAARQLAGNPDLARQMGQAGRDRVLENFTQERMVDEYISLYESLL